MESTDPEKLRALDALGLGPNASLADAKAAFRSRAKRLHPDHTPATAETLSQLALAVKAIRHLETTDRLEIILTVTVAEAQSGVSRTVTHKGRSGVFRIFPDSVSGMRVSAIGDPAFIAKIRVATQSQSQSDRSEFGLNAFIDEFVKGSPASRLAGWLRKARSAA